MASRRCEEFQSGIGIESLLGSDTKKLLFRSSVVDGRPAQKDDRAAQDAVVACAPGLLNKHPMSHMGQKPHLRKVRCWPQSGRSASWRCRLMPNSEFVVSFDRLVIAAGCCARAAIGPPVRYPSRRLRAIPKDNLLGQIDEGAQARGHVTASWIIEAISGIRGRPLA